MKQGAIDAATYDNIVDHLQRFLSCEFGELLIKKDRNTITIEDTRKRRIVAKLSGPLDSVTIM